MHKTRYLICLIAVTASGFFWQNFGAEKGVRLLISRPNNYTYTVNQKTIWIPALTEATLYFKLNTTDKLNIVPLEKITPLLSDHRNFERRVALTKYTGAAKKLAATHILYSEYEIQKGGKAIKMLFSVYDLDKSKKPQKTQMQIPLNQLNGGLSKAAFEITRMLGISEGEMRKGMLKVNVLGSNPKNVKILGNCIKAESSGNKNTFAINGKSCERIAAADSKMFLSYFVGSRLYQLAGNGNKAAELMQSLVYRLGRTYPKLYLLLAECYRKSSQLGKATDAINEIAQNPNLQAAVLWENGLIYSARGKREQALSSFQNLLKIEKSNPNSYVQIAKLHISLNDKVQAQKSVRDAVKLSAQSEEKIYFEIGNQLVKEDDISAALIAYQKCTELAPDNEKTWSTLITLQKKEGLDSQAALSCLRMFQFDIIKYESYLGKAGRLFEKSGAVEKARKIYSDAFRKHKNPKFAILLAKLEYNQKNCDRVKDLLEPLESPWNKDYEVKNILNKCYEDHVPPKLTLNGPNPLLIEAGSGPYSEPGAKSVDDVDGDLTHFIKVIGSVNTSVLDTYIVTYAVTDGSHNRTVKTRSVIVSDNIPPVLELIGPSEIKLEFGNNYEEFGAMAMDSYDGNLTTLIKISGTVDPDVVGVYMVTYTVADKSGNKAAQKRKVSVLGDVTPPEMKLIGSTPMFIRVGDEYEERGCKAVDNIDGDLTQMKRIHVQGRVNTMVPGSYKIVYSATDGTGNASTLERVVNVYERGDKIDKKPPEIYLIGGSEARVIYVGDEYEEPGVNAKDDVDGDITASIKIEGEINLTLPGEYSIKYTAMDKSGNTSVEVLKVHVRKRGEREKKRQMASMRGKSRRGLKRKKLSYKDTQTGIGLSYSDNGRKKELAGLFTALGHLGTTALGIFFDIKLSAQMEEWKDLYKNWKYEVDDDQKAGHKQKLDSKEREINKQRLGRNLCFMGAGGFGIGFTINLVIPKMKRR